VSHRALEEEARQETLDRLQKTLKEGQVVRGPVVSIQSFGAFIDIGGVQALLPVSELGRARVEDVSSVLSVGQEVEAVILKLDWRNERISLSRKSFEADPWDRAVEKYPEGSKHTGKVARVTTFGAFVALEPGLDGLIHVSEFRAEGRFGERNEVTVKVGQTLSVQVLGVDPAQKRISLKSAASKEEDETTAKYLGGSADGDTYNPFAALLKNKKK
jgi:small subunit ribosomal protein S1